MGSNEVIKSFRAVALRCWAFIAAAMLLCLFAPTSRTLAQTRPSFADVATTATTVTEVNPLVVPFHHACQLQNEFEARRCLQARPGLQANVRAGRWRADIEDDALVSISLYDFEHHQFEVTVRGVLWRGANPPTQSTGQDFVLATSQTFNANLRQSPVLRRPVVVLDESAAEAWRSRNTPDHLVVSIVFRVIGPPWVDQIDPDGMSPTTRFGMTMRPLALQVRNRESGEVLVETVFDDSSAQSNGNDGSTAVDASVTSNHGATALDSGPVSGVANDAGTTLGVANDVGSPSAVHPSAIAETPGPDFDLTSANHWIRPGLHPTLAASVASRRRIAHSIQFDVDGDGVSEQLLTVNSPGGEDDGFVVVRHEPSGWRATLLTNIVQEGAGVVDWRDTLIAGQDRYIQLWQHYDNDVGGECAEHSRYMLYRARPDGSIVRVFAGRTRNCAQERWTLMPRPDGAVLIVSSDRRYRLLRWNERRAQLIPGPWSRRPPR